MKKLLGAIILVLAVGVGQPMVFAYDAKSYNGNACQAYFGSQETFFNHEYSGLFNNSTSAIWASCIKVRDNFWNSNGTNSSWVRVTDNSTTQTFTCCQASMTYDGRFVDLDCDATSAAFTGGDWLNTDTETSRVGWGSYMMYCLVPGRSRINSFHEFEWEGSGGGTDTNE